MCTQPIVHTMLKESDIAGHSARRTHRTYTREFKAELVAACQLPGVSIAALASRHAMNANVLHRWLKEHKRSGCHQLIGPGQPGAPVASSHAPAFIPLKLPAVINEPRVSELKVELRKGALSMTVAWPLGAAADFAQWTTAVLK
ncbi:MAG: transposase [Burkholderiaceae bacterium]|nr:transposase [Burkholderiaceae bacterium]